MRRCGDLSQQLDFRIVGDIEGEWRNESEKLKFSFDDEGHMLAINFGCRHGLHSLVGLEMGKSDSFKPGSFALSYKADGGEGKKVKVARGELIGPGLMRYLSIYNWWSR